MILKISLDSFSKNLYVSLLVCVLIIDRNFVFDIVKMDRVPKIWLSCMPFIVLNRKII